MDALPPVSCCMNTVVYVERSMVLFAIYRNRCETSLNAGGMILQDLSAFLLGCILHTAHDLVVLRS